MRKGKMRPRMLSPVRQTGSPLDESCTASSVSTWAEQLAGVQLCYKVQGDALDYRQLVYQLPVSLITPTALDG